MTVMHRPARVCSILALALALPAWAPAQVAGPTLVMPFERITDDSRLVWLAEGSAILIADDFNALGGSALTRPERVSAFERLGLPPATSLTRATVVKVGEAVGAADVVVGTVAMDGDELTVRARRLDLEAGRLEPEAVERGRLDQLFVLFERLTRRLGGGSPRVSVERTYPPVEAFEAYVKGLVAETPATQMRFLGRAIEVYPDYARARLALWAVLSELGRHDEALETVQAVPTDSPLARWAGFSAAVSLLDLGRLDEAFDAFDRLARVQAAPAVLNNLGLVQLRRGGAPRAGMPTYFLTKAADSEPGSADYAFNVGYAYARAGDMPAALYWLREAVRRNPADGLAHQQLAAALDATGAGVEAARERELAGQLAPDLLQGSGSDGSAVPAGLERVMREIETPRAQRLEAAMLSTVTREQRELAAFHLDRGRRLVEQGQDRAAIPELRRAIYLSPYLADAHVWLGRVYLRAGRVREAVDAFKISIWSQETVEARLALARAYLQNDDVAAARGELRRVLELDPESAEARQLLAELGRGGRP